MNGIKDPKTGTKNVILNLSIDLFSPFDLSTFDYNFLTRSYHDLIELYDQLNKILIVKKSKEITEHGQK